MNRLASTDLFFAETASGESFDLFVLISKEVNGLGLCRVDVIIDDQLFLKIPRWEALTREQQNLYHGDRDNYEKLARKGSSALYFARGEDENETWV